jgi:NAD(P)-dependent dehydrogenase (short-subunit alcohol dehydrogenase family)
MGRMSDVSEIIGPIVFLSTKASSYMTGATLIIDGGWTAW